MNVIKSTGNTGFDNGLYDLFLCNGYIINDNIYDKRKINSSLHLQKQSTGRNL